MAENINNAPERGGISVETEHIFPIIKKWLYSEKEIFLRELVSNACDAVTKLRRLISLGEVHDIDDSFRINVTVDKEAETLTISDNGIGMTAEEVKKYICQMALSGALDFIKEYENTAEENGGAGIIGHFGLGFYSAFMVADRVELYTRSFKDESAVHWECDEAGEYTYFQVEKESRGTEVILHISEEEKEFLSESKIREVLDRYCAFMPVEIYLEVVGEEKKEGEEAPAPINDTHPLWQKNPSDCTEEEYKEFYQKLFRDFREPLFHVHINADYPLNFKGILYFPKLNHEFDSLEGQVKLYYNQVFVADNIKEVIPEYMLMLKGVLDCPELPLNVSRSYLQNNSYITKLSAHIVKKVADKLMGLYNTDRPRYEQIWDDIKLFVEYAGLKDRKFFDRVKSYILLPLTDGRYVTVDEYLEQAKEQHENTVYYCSDKVSQAQYISMFTEAGIQVVMLDRVLDTQFATALEQDKGIKFKRIDSDIADALKGDGEVYDNTALASIFIKVSGNEKLKVQYEALKDGSVPALINISEEARRIDDMMKMYRVEGMGDTADVTLILNTASSLVRRLGDKAESQPEACEAAVKQIYALALLSQRQLTAEELKGLLESSFTILENSL